MKRPDLRTCTDEEFQAYEAWLTETLTKMVNEAKGDGYRRWAIHNRTWTLKMLRADRYKAQQPKSQWVRIG